MQNPVALFQLGKAFLSLVKDPNQLDMVFKLSDRVDNQKVLQGVADAFGKTEYGQKALADRPRLGAVDMQKLLTLPAGTLGHEFAKHMLDRGLKLEDIPTLPGEDALHYVRAHLYETPDIWHVVTGFETDVAGELGLQAFYLAQLPATLAGVILATGFLNTVFYKLDEKEARMFEITRGWQMGKRCKPLSGIQWQTMWAQPLKQIRAELGITADLLERAC
jgi:ubiquinone biosynthesis protein Coq4